jgi:two-component system CheB/CheR fusion protein
MYGYSAKEALKMNVLDMVPKHNRKEISAFIKKVQEEDVKSLKTQRLTKDGKTLDVWLTITRLQGEDGNPVAIATTERDISGIK